jgi:hypothetical protein
MRRYIMINNNDLTDVMMKGEIVGTKKMNIKGQVRNMDVYRIPIDRLYYNDKNDRIATWISKYESENGSIRSLDTNAYNDKIQEYIIKSDKQKFVTTMNNIRNFSQLEAGVVFIDGRVIDGNRRFTCLRKLFQDTGDQSFAYFDAVILNNEISEKEIKLMELVLQHGQEGKVDYNPIEKLVGIYRDIIKDKLFDVKEYAKSIDTKESDVEKSVQLAGLMEDFLEYINAPEQFYIARELEIDGPLNEIYNIKKRIGSDEEKWEKVRIALYDNMLVKTNNQESGDITRIIRDFGKKVVENDEIFDTYFEKHEEYSRELNSRLNNSDEIINTDFIRKEIREDEELKSKISNNLEEALYNAKKGEARKKPIELLKSINDDISKIDTSAVSRLRGEDREEFNEQLVILKEKISNVEEKFNEII